MCQCEWVHRSSGIPASRTSVKLYPGAGDGAVCRSAPMLSQLRILRTQVMLPFHSAPGRRETHSGWKRGSSGLSFCLSFPSISKVPRSDMPLRQGGYDDQTWSVEHGRMIKPLVLCTVIFCIYFSAVALYIYSLDHLEPGKPGQGS